MKSLLLTRVLVLSALLCPVSYAAPTARVKSEPDTEYASPGVDQWFDLLVTVNPDGTAIVAKGLKVTAEGGLGAEVKAAIFPPPDKDGHYRNTFVVRVPMRMAGGLKQEVTVKITGVDDGGKAVAFEARGNVRTESSNKGHVTGKAKLKAPAVAGEPNAIVLELSVMEPYHVYGTAIGDDGIPLMGRLVPGLDAGAEVYWTGGAASNLDGKDYHGALTLEIPFTPVKAGKVSLRALISWQACTEQFCDANEVAYLPLSFDVKAGTKPVIIPVPGSAAAGGEVAEALSDDDDDIKTKSLWQIVLAAIGAGLFALAMPCTYPLIPITISFFTKQAEQRNGKVTGLAMAYGAGIVGVFMVAGVLVGQAILVFAALWWVNLIFALMFLYFGLSLIGLFEIRLPSFLNNLASKTSGTGGYMSVFAMGTTLVITSFTCTAPFVGSLLVFAAAGGSTATLALAMGVFGLTMAIPFVFLSLSPKGLQAMPKSGVWMKTLKVTLGIIELGLVLKFASNVDIAINRPFYITRGLFLVLWATSFLAAGVYLLNPLGLFRRAAKWDVGLIRSGFAVLMLTVAVYLGAGADGRQRAPMVEAFVPPDFKYAKAFLAVVHEDYEEGVRVATMKGAPIFLHFTGWV